MLLTKLFTDLFVLLSAHYIGDYEFNSDYLVNTKGRSYYSLFTHCMLYTFAVVVGFVLVGNEFNLPLVVMIILISHLIIDKIKCNYMTKIRLEYNRSSYSSLTLEMKENNAIIYDQIAHIAIVFFIYAACFIL